MFLTASLGLFLATAQPAGRIDAIVNAASLLPPALAAGAVPPGAQVLVRGRNLGPETPVESNAGPPPARLGGVAVRVTRGSASWNARLVRVSIDSILAVIPAEIAPGAVSIVVERDGEPSAPFSFSVSSNGFAIFTLDGMGGGRTLEHSVARGAIVTMRGTGLARSEKEIEVFVAGRAARRVTVLQDARGAGREEVRFEVPANAPRGCYVPVQVRLRGAQPSNVATLAIEPDQADCLRTGRLGSYISRGGRAGIILPFRLVLRSGDQPSGSGAGGDGAVAAFREGNDSGVLGRFLRLPPPGACMAWGAPLGLHAIEKQMRERWLPSTKSLDAGAIRIETDESTRTVAPPRPGLDHYYQILGGLMPGGGILSTQSLFLKPGELRIHALGGVQVGAFPVRVRMPDTVRWTNNDDARDVSRHHDLIVKWRSSSSRQWVAVAGISSDESRQATAAFLCVEDSRAESLKVPAPVLQTLPASHASPKQSRGYMFLATICADSEYLFFPYDLDALISAGVYIEGRHAAFR